MDPLTSLLDKASRRLTGADRPPEKRAPRRRRKDVKPVRSLSDARARFEQVPAMFKTTGAVRMVRRTVHGFDLDVTIDGRHAASTITSSRETIAGIFKVARVDAIPDSRDSSRAWLVLWTAEPLAEVGGLPWPWQDRDRTSVWEPIPFAIGEDGQQVDLSLVGKHALFAGESGSGKSVALSMICAAAALDPECRLFLMDANVMQLGRWRGSAERFVTGDMAEANGTLEFLIGEMDRRNLLVLDAGLDKLDASLGEPPIVLVIDELADFLMRRDDKDFEPLLTRLVARGRASGVHVIAATQTPTAKILDTALRNNFAIRAAGRTRDPRQSDVILGDGAAGAGANAASIDPDARGVMFLHQDGAVPRRVRTFYPSPDDVRDLAARAAQLRGAS